MICIPDGAGWLLVAQTAHSLSCGGMAAAWGNDLFAQPAPRQAIILATQLHDIGWLALDPYPFASPELVVGIEARWLGTQTFRDLATYHNAPGI